MKKAVFFVAMCLYFLSVNVQAQSLSSSDRAIVKIKSVFIYNFTLYIDWPEAYKTGNFVVGVLADKKNMPLTNATHTELLNMAKTKKAGTQTFQIDLFNDVSSINKCHIIYIPTGMSDQLDEVISLLEKNKYSTLIVTDKEGLAQKGAAVNFVRVDNRQKFELNENNAKKYNLKLASKFKNLAIIVE